MATGVPIALRSHPKNSRETVTPLVVVVISLARVLVIFSASPHFAGTSTKPHCIFIVIYNEHLDCARLHPSLETRN